jgi:hypothetical protein
LVKVEIAKRQAQKYFIKLAQHVAFIKLLKHALLDFTTFKKLQALKTGTAFIVTDVIKFGDKYRFKLKNGEYISAKRAYFEKV